MNSNAEKLRRKVYRLINKFYLTIITSRSSSRLLSAPIQLYTDADGSDADNLTLSKKRAESVKASLVKDFGIDASRLETDGKGESQPVDKNSTPEGNGNNRRVEFIKL